MGRHEQPLDPDASPVARFAAELRSLRGTARRRSYRELAHQAHYSASALAAAAAGKTLPTLNLTLAYVIACGGDVEYWRERWRTAAEEVSRADRVPVTSSGGKPTERPGTVASTPAPSPPATPAPSPPATPAPSPPATPAPPGPTVPGLVRRRALFAVAGVVILAVAVVVTAQPRWYPGPPEPPPVAQDGRDPKQTGCSGDARSLDIQPLTLTVPTLFGYQLLPAGTVIGSVEVPKLIVTYGDILLTSKGCVVAAGTVRSTGGQVISGATDCRGRPSAYRAN